MAAINNDWLDALKEEFKKPYYKKLFETVNEEYRTRQIFPPADDIFNASLANQYCWFFPKSVCFRFVQLTSSDR